MFFAVYCHHSLNEAITQKLYSVEKFHQCCETLPTDWAVLLDAQTGVLVRSYQADHIPGKYDF